MRKMVVNETFQINGRCLFTMLDRSIGLIDSGASNILHQMTLITSSTLAILHLSLF